MNQPQMSEYRARRLGMPRTSYISFSKIKLILEGKPYFWAGYGHGKFREPSKEMLEGKRIDKLLLEPADYKRNVVVSPFGDFRSRDSWKWREETLKANPQAMIITEERAKQDQELLDSVMSHPEVQNIFKDIDWLRYGYATDPEFGLLHWQPDLRTKQGMMGDIKAVQSVDTSRFNWQLENMRWYVQLGFYGHGNFLVTGQPNRDNKFFLAVEKEFPYRARVFTLKGDYDLMADRVWMKGAAMIRDLLTSDPALQNRALWFEEDHKIQDLAPTFKYVNYGDHSEDFAGLQLGG